MEQGWIKLYRKIRDNGIWCKSQYAHLWIHILLSATRKEREVIFNEKPINLQPGQFLTGRTSLTADTRIPGSSVERILKYLENEQLIGQQKTNKFRIITVKDWDKYQPAGEENGQHNGQQADNKRTTSGQQNGHRQEEEYKKEEKEEKKKGRINAPPTLSEQFDLIDKSAFATAELALKGEFLDYWTERSLGGKKERWQMQKVFDVRRRFRTWCRNAGKFGGGYERKKNTVPMTAVEAALKKNPKLSIAEIEAMHERGEL